MKLNFNENKNIDQVNSYVSKIKDLFTFLTGKSNIIGLFESNDDNTINIFLPIIVDSYSSKFQRGELFEINENNIQRIFESWFENYVSLNGVYDLYFSTINSDLSSETLFLTYCQILESYHRKRYAGEYVSEKDFELFKDKFISCATKIDGLNDIVSKEFKGQFLNKVLNSISFSFEFTLKDRLKELFSELTELDCFMKIVSRFVDEEDDDKKIKSFCDIIKSHRNYFTHYGEEPKNMLKDLDFLTLIDSLEKIIWIIFLKEFGFSTFEINNITKNPRFKFIEYFEF